MKRSFTQFHMSSSTGMPCGSFCAMNQNMTAEGTTSVVSLSVFVGLICSILLVLSVAVLASIIGIVLLILALLVLLVITNQLNLPASIDCLSQYHSMV